MAVPDHLTFVERLKASGHEFRVFYDVGANVGRWSAMIQQAFPDARFEMFEPLAGRLPEVDAGSMHDKVRNGGLHPVALSDRTGPTEIKILGNAGVGSSILVMDADRRRDLVIVPCEEERMDDIVARCGLPQPDFIKIDTQAAELKVLQGAETTMRNNKFILLETWMRRVYGPQTPLFHEIAGWLYSRDYVLYEMLSLDEGRDADGTLRWFDAVFINKSASRFASNML